MDAEPLDVVAFDRQADEAAIAQGWKLEMERHLFVAGARWAYLDATAPSRAPIHEITMQDVRLMAGEGELSATTVLNAVNAHLRREAGREVGGGVTRPDGEDA